MCVWHSQKIPANHLYGRMGTCWLWESNQETTFHIPGLALEVGPGIQLGGEKGIYTSCKCSRALRVRPDSRVMGETCPWICWEVSKSCCICCNFSPGSWRVQLWVQLWAVPARKEHAGPWVYPHCSPAGWYFWILILMDSLVIPHRFLIITFLTHPLQCVRKEQLLLGVTNSPMLQRAQVPPGELRFKGNPCCLHVTRANAARGCSSGYQVDCEFMVLVISGNCHHLLKIRKTLNAFLVGSERIKHHFVSRVTKSSPSTQFYS